MKKPFKPMIMVFLALATTVTCGCSKRFTKKTKIAGAAIAASVIGAAHYFGNAFGLKHKKCTKLTEDACTECKETEEITDAIDDVLSDK